MKSKEDWKQQGRCLGELHNEYILYVLKQSLRMSWVTVADSCGSV